MSSQKIYKDTVGTKIILDCGTDISQLISAKIYYKKPSGSVGYWTANLEETQKIYYTVQDGDLDEAGQWELQAYIELPNWKGFGQPTTFSVYDHL